MNPDTGEILAIKDELEAKLKGLIPLTDEAAEKLMPMPPSERPGALLDLIAEHPLAKHHATSAEDLQKIRNRMKAERRECAGK
jgi:hypothetical protein